MFDSYLIEVSGKPAGVLARDTHGYRFHASENAFNGLDGRIFPDPSSAERAARKHLARRSGKGGNKQLQEPNWGSFAIAAE